MPTLFEAKGQARRLAHYLTTLGYPLTHTQALEAIARSHGARHWNAYAASLADPAGTTAATPPATAPAPASERTDPEALFEAAHAAGAHTVSLAPCTEAEAVKVLFRCDNGLQHHQLLSPAEASLLAARLQRLFADRTHLDRSFQDEPFRVSYACLSTTRGPFYVVKLAPLAPSLDQLGLFHQQPWLATLGAREAGLYLVTGRVGAGKSVTLRATARHLGITPLADFPGADRHLQLRCDPEVMVLDELRDEEDVAWALRLVDSGHTVVASLHAEDHDGARRRLRHLLGAQAERLPSVLKALLHLQCVASAGGFRSRRLSSFLPVTPATPLPLPPADFTSAVRAYQGQGVRFDAATLADLRPA